ncbi:probable helicase MAGATAMA 3 [Rhagoletis pomonella]|uniref:probable helicase MAGATAMA 3 n=1 Tax=Rhagoletis pomonella TaxID=28610 RepID=UPI001785AD89|nr:probable helicase MAGATAMA 3 [Rhagoletis pomonella]
MVNTIDSYQGMECDVIIISNARTTGIGFLANYQRLNVALTRPKKCLILCGNFKNLEAVPAWRSLLASARERKLYHELSADCMDDMHRSVIPKIKISKPTVTADTATATTRKESLAVVPT